MTARTLYDKLWDEHVVHTEDDGTATLYIDRHLVHEVTSPQAFEGLRLAGRKVWRVSSIVATADHNTPTTNWQDGYDGITDPISRLQVTTLDANIKESGAAAYFPFLDKRQGIVHVIGPENGATLPGMTVVCGDSHTSTHGAFGALAFGIGTSQVRDVLASQTMSMSRLKVRKIQVDGRLKPGVYAKDLILHVLRKLTAKGGVGFAYEFNGTCIAGLSMEERMTICNMSIEAGARAGMIAPDQTTFDFVEGRPYAPKGEDWTRAVAYWKTLPSDADATFDREIHLDASQLEPMVTYGTNPGQGAGISGHIPESLENPAQQRALTSALEYMGLRAGQAIAGLPVDVVFIGSCTNGRLEDLRLAAGIVKGKRISSGVLGIVVPGSKDVRNKAEAEGLDQIFLEAGFEWRGAGCSMCLAMNEDKAGAGKYVASTSNRNFQGRQGPGSRSLLMSPLMAAAAAVNGRVTDVRTML